MRSYCFEYASETYNYPDEVVFQIERDKIEDYYRAVDYINQSNADIAHIPDYGIFVQIQYTDVSF
ncbi:hypothetical protein BGV40_10925 [Methanosarcina sp. Ant1]|nr:hypothetical protein BGV40_10925 [Methanosarcina sp. Ant1]